MLKFLGNGSGFTNYHNNCYFVDDEKLTFIDLSMLNIEKALKIQKDYKDVAILITHMHDDHVSGICLFSQYLFYVYHKKLKILIPKEWYSDIKVEFRIKGIDLGIVDIIMINDGDFCIEKIIPTSHTPELDGKCFGYVLKIGSKRIVYSGDTNDLSAFVPYLKNANYFYVDVSYSYGGVHLKWDDIKDELYEISEGCMVYLMHMDDIESFKSLDFKTSNIRLAEIY